MRTTDDENARDKLLQIKTSGRDDTNSDENRYPYDPTPYSVLKRLASTELFGKDDVVLDYCCGKGRSDFFCPIARKQSRSDLNTTNTSTKVRSKIARLRSRERRLTLC